MHVEQKRFRFYLFFHKCINLSDEIDYKNIINGSRSRFSSFLLKEVFFFVKNN